MQSLKFLGIFLQNLRVVSNPSIVKSLNNKVCLIYCNLVVNSFSNLSLAHSKQWLLSSGNILRVQ